MSRKNVIIITVIIRIMYTYMYYDMYVCMYVHIYVIFTKEYTIWLIFMMDIRRQFLV